MIDEEEARISRLKGYGILDTPNEPEFDAIVREAADEMQTPIALISLVDENRQWFKARIGIEPQQTPRSISFCTHAIQGSGVFVVEDAAADDRFRNNPLVTGDPNIRFYAGAPLRTSGGERIGTICVISDRPRKALSFAQRRKLAELADRTIAAFERRRERLLEGSCGPPRACATQPSRTLPFRAGRPGGYSRKKKVKDAVWPERMTPPAWLTRWFM